MVNLCYRTFLELIQQHLVYEIESEVLARGILEVITPETEHQKFNGPNSSSYLSLYWSRTRNIPKDIIASSQERKSDLVKYFKKYIISDLNPSTVDDFYDKLSHLISNDDTILSRKKTSLNKLSLGDKDKYLAEVFLYAITKQNKEEIAKIDNDTIPLLAQVDQRCPLCYTPLIKTLRNGKIVYVFTATRIYPEYLDSSIKDQFDSIKQKPTHPDDIQNKICLCDACSLDYLHNPSPEKYTRLLSLKKKAAFRGTSSSISTFELEEKIITILDKILVTNPEGPLLSSFKMKPLDPCHKIPDDNYLLIKSIKDDNEVFFWFIREHISTLDANKSSFRIIASEIRSAFLKLEDLGYSQDEIFQGLIDWIINKHLLTDSYKEAAHIIVSYFVQSCEVFHEIS